MNKQVSILEGLKSFINSSLHKTFLLLISLSLTTSLWSENAVMTSGTNGSAATVNNQDAIKVGTSSKGGDMSITVGENATELKLHAAAWKGVSGLSLNISGATVSPSSISLTADDGISNNSPFTLSGDEDDFEFTITLSDITDETTITFTSSIAKRFVVWGATYTTSGGCISEVDITKGAETNGTYTLSAAKVCADDDGGTVTISDISPASGYQFKEITTSESGTVDNVNKKVTGIKAATTITVVFEAIPTYTVNWYVNNPSTPAHSQTSVAGTALSGIPAPTKSDCDNTKVFVGWTTDATFSGTTAQIAAIITNTSTLTMPEGSVDYYAVFAKSDGAIDYAIDFESENSSYTDWTFTNITSKQSGTITAHTGSYYGATNGTATASIVTNSKIASPGTFTTYVSKQTNNTTASTWYIQVSSDGSTWIDVADRDAKNMSKGEWKKFSTSLSAYSDVYVRIYYDGSTAVRNLDSLVLSCGSYSEYTISCGPSVSITPNSLTAERPNTGTANVTATANLFTPASWTWGTSDPAVATVSGSGASATVTYKGSGTCTISCTGTQGSTSATGYCTVTVPQSFTITLVDNGTSTDVANRVAGEVYTLPFGTSSCPDYTFLGWVTSNYTDGTATAPTGIVKGEQTLAGATTYYAVYSFEDKETKSYSPIDDPDLLVEGAHIAIYGNSPKLKLKTDGTVASYSETIITSTVLTSIPLDEIWTVKLTGDADYPHALYNGSQYLATEGDDSGDLAILDDNPASWNIRSSLGNVSGTMQIEKTFIYDLELYNGKAQLYQYDASATQNWILLEKYATTYTKQPSCGPTIKAEGEPYITSANGLTIQAVDSIDVYGTMLTSASTLSATSDNAKFTATLKSNTITDGKITTKLAIKYTPTSANTTDNATITLKDNLNLTSKTIAVHGRSLPNSFVIVAKDATDTWRAVPANMPEASTYTGIPTDVDSDSDPASADRTAINTHYSLSTACTTPATGASHSRYDSVPWTVRFVGDEGKCLYGAKSGNQIYNGVNVSTAKQPYEWILLTNDNETYFIKSNNNANDRSLCMNTTNQIGLYASGNKEFRILPYTERCYYFAQPIHISAASIKSTSAKIVMDSVPYAKQYQYKVNGDATWTIVQLSEIEYVNPASSKQVRVPVTGLTRGVQNTILIRGTDTSVSDADLCAENPGTEFKLTTTLCDYVVNLGTPYPSSTTATISWTMDGFSCNNFVIRLYSDEEATVQVGTDIHATKSPLVLTDLSESTQYYYRVYAAETGVSDPGCPSAIGEFMTKNPSVEIMTWHPEQVDIMVNMGGTPVVMIYDEVTHGEETSGQLADDIFFSKYFEASANVKLIGIFNGTADTVDLAKYQLWQAQNGPKSKNSWYRKTQITNLQVLSGPTTSIPRMLAPQTELILISYSGQGSDIDIIDCAASNPDKSGWNNYYYIKFTGTHSGYMDFNGDDAVALYRIEDGEFIDLIGAGTTSDDDLDNVVSVSGDSNQPKGTVTKVPDGRTDIAVGDQVWMDNYGGWYTTHGTDTLGNSGYELATNRCLLIRKNTVRSGYNTTNQGANNAVDLNTSDFVTLGDHDGVSGEWFGVQIPNVNGAGEVDKGVSASCTGFSWVGGYNYTDYYKAFELKVDSTRLDTVGVNDDGTYRIPVDTLYKMSCSKLKVQVFANPGDKKPSAENVYKVPIIVYERNTDTNDAIFTKHGNQVCKECDVIIRDGKTLSSATSGVDSVGHIIVYEGSKLNLTDKKLNAASLTLRARQDVVSAAYIPNNTQLADVNGDGGQPNVYFEKFISDEDWHWITVPYPVNVAEITFTDNTPCVYRTDYWIKWYDGEARADNPSQADGRNWKHLDPSTTPQLLPGVGYIIAIADQKEVKDGKRQWKALRFPMAGYNETDGKNVTVKAYGAGSEYTELTPNNKGWNLVGNPYLSYYNGFNAATPLQTGKLEVFYDSEGLPYYDYDPETTSLYYVTIPQNGGKSEYSQELVTATELPPFTSYFVQIAGTVKNEEKSVLFNNSGRKTMIQQRYTDDEEKEKTPVFVGIQLSNSKNEIDNTGLCIHNQYAQSVYEVGADLYKWKGTKFTEYTKPVCFSMSEAGEMAFNALSEAEAARTNAVPLSCYTLMDGQYTFKLNEAYDLSRVESVILYDSQSNIYTDITQNSYEFNSTASTEAIKDRFYVSVTIRKEPSITTSFGEQTIGNNKVIKFVTPDGHLHIARDGVVYDIHGRIEQIVK